MFAQVQNVEPEFLKSFILLLLGLLGGAASVAGVVGVFLKKKRVIEPQPLEVREALRFITVEQQAEVVRRVDAHDRQFQEIWNTLRSENTAIRSEMRQWFQDTERALGRIEGKIDSITKD